MIPFARILTYGNKVVYTVSVQKILCNLDNIIVLYSNGELYGWGSNSQGNLGIGDRVSRTQVTLLSTSVKDIWMGTSDTLILKNDGKYYYAGQGTLGFAANTAQNSFTDCTSLFGSIAQDDIKTIDLGAANLTVLLKNGDLYSCGLNGNGQYGNGLSTTQRYAVLTKTLSNITAIKGNGNYGMFCVKSDGLLYGAGANDNSQLGSNSRGNLTSFVLSTSTSYNPIDINNLATFRIGSHLRFINDVYVSGSNSNGALGNGATTGVQSLFSSRITASTLPVTGIIRSFSSLANFTSAMYVCNDGVYITGDGSSGALGSGSTTSVSRFTKMSSLSSIVQDYNKVLMGVVSFYSSYIVYEDKIYACGGGSNTTTPYMLPGYTTPQLNFVQINMPY